MPTHLPELVTSALAGGAVLCVDCIARKTGILHAEVLLVIAKLDRAVGSSRSPMRRCNRCVTTRKVYWLA